MSDWSKDLAESVIGAIDTDPYPGSRAYHAAVADLAAAFRQVDARSGAWRDISRKWKRVCYASFVMNAGLILAVLILVMEGR